MAEPDPSNVAPWYLRNINQALELNEATGQVFVRTGFEGNIIITGNVNIPGNVDAHISEIGTSGNLTVPWMPVSIDGNSNVTIAGGNVNVTQGTSPWVVSGNVGLIGTSNVALGGTQMDAFGRLRVSNPVTLFDSQNRYIDGEQFASITATGGNVVYVANESSFNLNVNATSGSSVIRQSKTVQAYQPGKSLLTMSTFAMATLKTNLRQRVGYFTEGNGIYFEADGTSLYLVIRSSTTGSVVEERIAQASWNGNTLLSGNPSGIVLDPTLTQIFWNDIEWLGVGNVRAGFVINGQFIVCHTFQHANQPGNTTVYMTTATLNPRYEITNTGTTSGASTMKQICSTVISEGGFTPSTKIGYVTNNTSATRVSSSNTVTSLCSIRLNPAYPDAVVIPAQVDLLLLDVRYGQFQIIENATIANASFSNIAGSVVQSAIHTDTITNGTVVYAGLTSSRDEVEIGEDIKKRLQLWRYANGTPSTLTLAVSYTASNADLLYKFGWEELTN